MEAVVWYRIAGLLVAVVVLTGCGTTIGCGAYWLYRGCGAYWLRYNHQGLRPNAHTRDFACPFFD